MDTKVISTITSHAPGYLDKEKEKIVGVQTDKPFQTRAAALRRYPHGAEGLRGQRIYAGP